MTITYDEARTITTLDDAHRGARVDDREYSVGDFLPPSRQWSDDLVVTVHCYGDDCEYVSRTPHAGCDCECATCLAGEPELLEGTSAIAVAHDATEAAIREAIHAYYLGGSSVTAPRIYLLVSHEANTGQDPGEIVMLRPRVVAILSA